VNPRLQVALAAALFSTGGAAIKSVGFGGWQVAAFRALVACATLLVLLPEARRAWSRRVVLVGLAYAATTLLFVQANRHTTAANAIFLQSTSPALIVVLAPLLLREPVRRRDLVHLAVMGAGMALFFVGAPRRFATAPDPVLGNVLGAACAVTWAFTLIGYRWLASRGGSVAPAAAAGNLVAAMVALACAGPLAAGRPADWLIVVYLGVVQLGLPYLLLVRAVPRLAALDVSLLLLIEPVLNPVWAWLTHGEVPSPAALAGGLVILAATALRSRQQARLSPAPGRADNSSPAGSPSP
jgi:drug/metabolite transporter (DMT)-like permease